LNAVLFNAGCNEQVFFLNPEKKISRKSVLSFLRKTQKPLNSNTLQFRKNDVMPKASLL